MFRYMVLLLLLSGVRSLPTVLLESGRAKCFSLEAPQDTVIRVLYSAPDVPLDKNSPGYTPTFLSVNVKPARRVVDTKLHSAPILSRLRPTNHMLEKSQGSIEHTMEVDGVANVCIRAAAASSSKPMRFGIRVVKTDTDPIVAQKGKTELDTHLSHMEVEMKRLTMGMSTILKEADFAKERDSVFHQQTVSMHAATTFWPMVQVSVLLLTGFTQASHIVRFFQSRRII